jgi:transposase InsO family protein
LLTTRHFDPLDTFSRTKQEQYKNQLVCFFSKSALPVVPTLQQKLAAEFHGPVETSERSVLDNTVRFTNIVDVESRKAMSWADVVAKKKTDVKRPVGISKLVGKQSANMLTLFTKRN